MHQVISSYSSSACGSRHLLSSAPLAEAVVETQGLPFDTAACAH